MAFDLMFLLQEVVTPEPPPPKKMNVLDANLYVIGKHLDSTENDAQVLLAELFPDTTTELLEDYERLFNVVNTGTIEERRQRVIGAHRQRGGLSLAYFEKIGNEIAPPGVTVTITEGSGSIGFRVAEYSPKTNPQGPATILPGLVTSPPFDDNCFYITVTVAGGSVPGLEALYQRLMPPWTIWSYDYI